MQTQICPICGQSIREFETKNGNKGVGCSNRECSFVIWRNSFGHDLTDTEIDQLLANKGTGNKIKMQFKSKQGNPYEGEAYLDDEYRLQRDVDFGNVPKI